MPAGKAYGKDREYQVQAKNILIHKNPLLEPLTEDGIDVPFDIAGTTVYMDIGLQDSQNRIVVGECKNTSSSIEQNELFAFAYKVEEVRKATNKLVAGIFFVKNRFQIGAVKTATYSGIEIAECKPNQSLESFVIAYLHYDANRQKQIREAQVHLSGTGNMSGDLSIKVIRCDGTIEEYDHL